MKITILGLSITSSWGNGHATGYRALARALQGRGDEVVFLERDMPWYAQHRDLPQPPGASTHLYTSLAELRERHAEAVSRADVVIVGSFVPDGVEVGEWALSTASGAVAFYDIDTPVTLEKLAAGQHEYLSPELIPRFDLYLSFTAGPALEVLQERYHARRAERFFCFVDGQAYAPVPAETRWELGYLGTYSAGRQPALEALLLEPARRLPDRRFVVAGPMYPQRLSWPENVERIEHLPPADHPGFFCASRLTLNVTRPEMRALGHSPSVRLFEAAACGVPIISDSWPGLEDVLRPGEEILLGEAPEDVLEALQRPPAELLEIGRAARRRVLAEHTAQRRAEQLHQLLAGVGVERAR